MSEKRSVLVVDDENQVRDFVSTVLEENGYLPLTAENGEEAMAVINGDRPALIIMDILMPKQGGIRLYRQLKSSPDLAAIPVVIYSGIAKRTFLRTQTARTEWGHESVPEPEAYIEKPARPEHLERIIREFLP